MSKIREIDLKPYQTHFLFQGDSSLTSKWIERLLKELPSIIDDGLQDDDEPCQVLEQSLPRTVKNEQIAWLTYSGNHCDGPLVRMRQKISSTI